MMNYETTRGGVTVTTEPGLKTHSRLIINNATPKDSGNYSCRSSNAEPDTTYVFVSHGKFYKIYRQNSLKQKILTVHMIYRGRQHGCNPKTRFFGCRTATITHLYRRRSSITHQVHLLRMTSPAHQSQRENKN